MPVGMDNIEHVVVLMMENRSLDILIGVATLRNNHQYIGKERAELMRQKIKTQKDAIDFMGPERLLAELP
jgi:phospholipase C